MPLSTSFSFLAGLAQLASSSWAVASPSFELTPTASTEDLVDGESGGRHHQHHGSDFPLCDLR